MRFTQTFVALAAFTSAVLATDPTAGFDAITSPSTKDQEIPAGSAFTITWSAASYTADSDTVSIIILAGNDPTTLQPGATITSIKNSVGSYTWTVPSSTAVTYGFKIQLNSDPSIFQYSQPFHITGGSTSSSSSVSSTASATSSSVSSSVSGTSSVNVTSISCSSASASTVTAITSSANITSKIKLVSATISNSANSSALATAASNTTLVAPTTSAYANTSTALLKSTIGATKTAATTVVGGSTSAPASSSSSATKPAASGNAAVSNMAQGGIALIGGLVLAFAL